jgi:NAD(P)-dependent dehydrogenase (short-subunit alcohol dehydrogenase family)
MNRLAGKTAIITGGAVGIGRACVQRLTTEGATVAIFDDPGAAQAAAGPVNTVGHIREPHGIGRAVVWLASDEAKFVTGADIAIDGGYTAR